MILKQSKIHFLSSLTELKSCNLMVTNTEPHHCNWGENSALFWKEIEGGARNIASASENYNATQVTA